MSLRETAKKLFKTEEPFAITMWEFSWIERRWSGAGYEDWDRALEELTDRGYNAVRIDAFPHLVAKDIDRVWTLNPVWNTQVWGSPAVNRICLKEDFREFLRACRRHHVRVGLSTWFRQDVDHSEMDVRTPEDLAGIWIKTLRYIEEWGEMDNILYVDLCNEFPHICWAPFLRVKEKIAVDTELSVAWMKAASAAFKKAYPDMPMTFSFALHQFPETMDVSYLDFLEPHIWVTNQSDFYQKVGYDYERFDDIGYTNVALNAEREFREHRSDYEDALIKGIMSVTRWAKNSGKPLVTTECWSLTDYKDGPLLNWDWILDLNRLGVETAISTGCWAGMATSNFCGPQFVGMWREKLWHKELTDQIKHSRMIEE